MKKKIEYADEPRDGWEFDASKALSEQEMNALGIPTPAEAARMPVVRLHGGARSGSGRKPSGHVRMQIFVSPVVRQRILALAKKEKTTMSGVIESRFATKP